MVLEGVGKVNEQVKGRIMIYIPAAVHKDSQFPFKPKDNVKVRIDGKQLIIEKV